MSQRFRSKVESGACNVCSAPCSSCMHLNKASMGSKRKEYSDESCSRDVGSQFYVNDGDVSPPFSGRASENPHLVADGKGNEARSGNIENSSSNCDTMRSKMVARPTNTGDHLSQKSHRKSDQMSSLNEHLERVECEDDTISCVSSALDNVTSNSDNMEQKSLGVALPQAEGNDIIDGIPDRAVKSFDEDSVEKLNKSDGSPESPPETPQGDESEEADIIEDDVKVCDICGDAGREDSLAICSRCSDGAEHTYCMREMLQKLPEGDWLCEECKLADESGKLDEGPETGGKKLSKVPVSSQVSNRGISEKVEVSSNLTVQIHETISSKSGKPGAVAVLSRDSSIKDTDKGRGKLLHQTSNASHSIHDLSDSVRAPTTSQLHPSKGALLKSNSFSGLNSKPKVKRIDEVASQKQKGRVHPLTNVKDGPLRTLSKSVSFKSANPGRLAGDSKVKMLPTKFSHAQELKGIRHVKDGSTSDIMNPRKLERSHTSLARNSSSVLTPKGDQKPSSGCDIFPLASGSNSRDSKVGQSDGKPSFSKTAFYKNSDLSISSEHKSNHNGLKDESVPTSSRTVDRQNSSGHGTRHDGLSRPRGLANLTEKTRETSGTSSRQIVVSCSKSAVCSICKDFGHDSESCPTSSSQVGASSASAARSVKEDGHGISKLKTPITSAMLKKPGIYRRSKAPDKLDDSSLSNHDPAPLTTQDPSVLADTSKKLISANGAPEKEAGQGSTSDSCKQIVNDKMQLAGLQAEVIPSFRKRNLNSQPDGKPYAIDLPQMTSALMSAVCRTSIVPELDYVWQGDFKVCKGTKQPDICRGFQAHLSTSASPKVLEAVKKFPGGIILSEVPRLCTWPAQFDFGVHDENIALFFFAKDTESYEKSYKGLVDNMIKCDLALKASWDGVELLIFPSNQLSEKSQRWNMFYYLWGVFRGRRAIDSSTEPGSLEKVNSSNLKEVPPHTGIPAATVSSVDESAFPKYNGENLSSCVRSCNLSHQSKDSAAEASGGTQITFSYEDTNRNPHSKGSTTDKMHSDFQVGTMQGISDSKMDMDLEPDVMGSNCSTSGGERMALRGNISTDKRDYRSTLKDMETDATDKMHEGRDDINLDEKDRKVDSEAVFRRDHSSLDEVDSPNCKKKRHHSEISKMGLETSAGTGQTVLWNNDNASVDKELNKKQKTGNIGMSEGSNCTNSVSVGNFASTNHQLGPKSATIKVFGKESDEYLKDTGTAERYFFPVVSDSIENLKYSDSSTAWKQHTSKVSSRSHDGVPNLELALGAEKRSTDKGIVPVLVGTLDKNDGQIEPSDKGIVKGDEDDASEAI